MSVSMCFYQDQTIKYGRTTEPLEASHRLLFIRHGAATVNGQTLATGEFAYSSEAISLQAAADWSEIWRWEISKPHVPFNLLKGDGILSRPKLSRVITTVPVEPGTDWLFRLDQITSAPGRVTPRHQHLGPGIRCLYQGTFNVEDQNHTIADIGPSDSWWKSGVETVVA